MVKFTVVCWAVLLGTACTETDLARPSATSSNSHNPYHFPVILSFTSDHELSRRFWDDIVLPLVYREENLRACKDHNLPEIRDRRYYEY